MVHWTAKASLGVAAIAALIAAGQLVVAILDRQDQQALALPQDDPTMAETSPNGDGTEQTSLLSMTPPDIASSPHRLFADAGAITICGGAHTVSAIPKFEDGLPAQGAFLTTGADSHYVALQQVLRVEETCAIRVTKVARTNKDFTDIEIYYEE